MRWFAPTVVLVKFTFIYSSSYLPRGFLDEALVCDSEGAEQRLDGVLLEELVSHQVDVEVVRRVDGCVYATVAIEHGEERLLLLVLRRRTRREVKMM